MNRRIVTGSYDDDDERPEREYRGDGEWDTSYRRRKPRSAAMIVGITSPASCFWQPSSQAASSATSG